LAAEPNVIEGESAEAELGEEHGAGGVEALDDGASSWDAIAKRFRRVGGGNVRGVDRSLPPQGMP